MAAAKKEAEPLQYGRILEMFRDHAELMHSRGAQCVTVRFGEIELTVMFDGDAPESGLVH
jgi:hypothetical protein